MVLDRRVEKLYVCVKRRLASFNSAAVFPAGQMQMLGRCRPWEKNIKRSSKKGKTDVFIE
jgi:hypothetical protein